MPKTSIDDWSTTANSNADINGISILGSARNSNVDNALREMMKQIADFRDSLDTRFATYFEDQGVYNPLNWPGIVDDGDEAAVTAAVNAFYASLPAGSRVDWPPMIVNLDGPICVYTDNIETRFSKGTIFRQKSWGRMVFLTADPEDTNVRPDGVSFVGPARFEAWSDGALVYFYDSLHGPDEAGSTEYFVQCETTSTIDNLRICSEGVVWEEGDQFTVSGWGTSLLTITLDVPHAAGTYISIKVTSKYDLFSYDFTPLMTASSNQKSNESAAIWHGGGDDFRAEGFHVEGFVCPVYIVGDWASNTEGNQSNRATIRNLTFNNCEFLLAQELYDSEVSNIIGGVVSETQTPDGSANYKAPHVIYWTNRVTPIQSQRVRIGLCEGDNRYSSIYKMRNINGLTVVGPVGRGSCRHWDIDGCTNVVAHFALIRSVHDVYKDTRAAALNIYACTNLVVKVDRLVIQDLDGINVLSLRPGLDEPGDIDNPTTYAVCANVDVYIDHLIIGGSASKPQNWVSFQGGLRCNLHVGHLEFTGDDDVHFFRVRSSGTDVDPVVNCIDCSFTVDKITCRNPKTLKLVQISAENDTTPLRTTIKWDSRQVVGATFVSGTTIIDGGTDTKQIREQVGYETVNTDVAFTLNTLVNAPEVRHTGTLTANRIITLQTANAQAGDRFKVTRTGAGAFTLNVGSGPLKALATNTWCEVTYDGSAWYLSAYGAL